MAERTDAPTGARGDEWRVVYGVLLLGAAGLLVWSIRPVLTPVVLYLVVLALLGPYAGRKGHALVVTVATVLMAIWLLDTLGGLLAPFILALAFAYILDPVVDLLEGRRISRGLAIGLLAIPVLGILVLIGAVAVPALVDQVGGLLNGLPDALSRLEAWFVEVRGWLGRLRVPFLPGYEPFRDFALFDPERIASFVQERQARILEGGLGAVLGVGRGLGAALAVLGYVILTPILVVYLLRDFDGLKRRAVDLIPPARREKWVAFGREFDRLLARFLRGQLIEATIVGLLTWIGLWIAGFPYSGLVGAIAGVFNLVPYLGLVASIVPVIVIALLSGHVLGSLLRAGIVFAIIQFIDGSITGPRIVGTSVGLHPVWVMLALAVGGFFFGFVGLLLAMPAAVFIKLLLREGVSRYRASDAFTEPGGADEAEAGEAG
jgi:predicted PurR-regulated permease PerM